MLPTATPFNDKSGAGITSKVGTRTTRSKLECEKLYLYLSQIRNLYTRCIMFKYNVLIFADVTKPPLVSIFEPLPSKLLT